MSVQSCPRDTSSPSAPAGATRFKSTLTRLLLVLAILIPALGSVSAADQSVAEAAVGFRTTDDVSARTAAVAAPSPSYGIPRNRYFEVTCQVVG